MPENLIIKAEYEVLTPLFLSGADQAKPELRISSIRGALRFWWRALAWSRCDGDLSKIREEESELFGSADAKYGQGMLMRFVNYDLTNWQPQRNGTYSPFPKEPDYNVGLKYLAYGVMNHKNFLSHGVFLPPSTFKIECRLNHKKAEHRASLQQALLALGTFGGLGAKSRKGFGSLEIIKLHIGTDEIKLEDPLERVNSLLKEISGKKWNELPSYSAFSNATKDECATQVADLDISEATAIEALAKAGFQLVRFRGWGQTEKKNSKIVHKIGSQKFDKPNFRDDHSWYANSIVIAQQRSNKNIVYFQTSHPERILFGLPHVYDKSTHNVKKRCGVKPVDQNRRAAPLIFHVYPKGEQNFGVLAVVFVSKFLPSDDVKVFSQFNDKNNKDAKEHTEETTIPLDLSWKPILDFLTHCKAKRISPASTAEVSNA